MVQGEIVLELTGNVWLSQEKSSSSCLHGIWTVTKADLEFGKNEHVHEIMRVGEKVSNRDTEYK